LALRTTPAGSAETSGGFSADHGGLIMAAQHVTDVADAIGQELFRLLHALSELEGQWEGQAAATFESVKQRWAGDQKELRAALHIIGDMLARSGQVYLSSDDEGQSGLTQIQAVLGE
jgi:WXG100 family type VII secretion target